MQEDFTEAMRNRKENRCPWFGDTHNKEGTFRDMAVHIADESERANDANVHGDGQFEGTEKIVRQVAISFEKRCNAAKHTPTTTKKSQLSTTEDTIKSNI